MTAPPEPPERAGGGPLDFGPDEPDDPPRGAVGGQGDGGSEPADAARPEARPARPGGAGRYGWVVGVAAFVLVVLAVLNGRATEGTGPRGLEPGTPVPVFAAPLADAPGPEADVNLATAPDQGRRGAVPACEVRGPRVLNVCELAEKGPLVLVFVTTRGGDCVEQLDAVERVRARHPDVAFAAVDLRAGPDTIVRLARERGWRFPIAYDRDGALAAVYGVAVCPTTVIATEGGLVHRTLTERLDAAGLERAVAGLRRADRRSRG